MCEVILNSVQSANLDHAKLDCFEPDHTEPNKCLRHQIILCRCERAQCFGLALFVVKAKKHLH